MTDPIPSPAPKNIIELLRVSTDLQDVARQRTDLERLKKRFNLSALRTLELHGVSGTATLDNKQVQQILKDLGTAEVDGIGLSSLDRLFRPKRYGQFAILDRFVDEGKMIWSLREGEIDPATDEGYDKCIQAGGRAGAEWRDLRTRTMGGRREKLEAQKLDCGKARYGYIYLDKYHPDPARRQTYALDPKEALPGLSKQQVVRDICAWCLAGMKTYSIAKRLNEMGILSAGDKRHPPGQWSQRTIRKLLASRTYTGEFMRSGTVVPCPQIIDLDTWHRVQERLEHNKQAHVGQPSSHYLLVNYLWCGKCQHRCTTHRTTHRTRVWGQYRCGHMSNKPPYTRYCDAPGIGQAKIEAAAFAMVWEVLTNPTLLLEMGRAYYENLPQPDSDGLKDLERELKELRGREEAIIELMKRRLVKISDGQQEIEQDIRPKLGVIREKLRMAGRIIRLPTLQEAEASLREITEGPMPETYQDRRNILQGIQDLRMEYLDGELEIVGKVPIRLNAQNQRLPRGRMRTIVKTMVSIDFFTVPTIRFQVLYVFLVLAHDRRRVVHFNVTAHPTAQWIAQQLREAFPFDQVPKYLLRDRDRIFGAELSKQVADLGIEEVLAAPRSPWQRAYVERVIGTIRREGLDHVIVFNEASLYRHVKSFVAYYHASRTHLSLAKDPPEARSVQPLESGAVVAIPQVGGLHHRYERRAA